jgi:hypothetical protein
VSCATSTQDLGHPLDRECSMVMRVSLCFTNFAIVMRRAGVVAYISVCSSADSSVFPFIDEAW